MKGENLKTFTSNGQKCNYSVYPKSKKVGINVPIATCKVGKEISFFTRYPGYTIDNLDTGIAYVNDKAVIQKTHPVVNMITMDAKSKDKNPKKVFKSFSKTHYQVDSALVIDTVNALKSNLQARIPTVKENELKMNIMRSVTSQTHSEKVNNQNSWRDGAEIYDNVLSEQSKPGILSKTYSFTASFRVKYRSIHREHEKK